jgi:uncharacterized protein YkwD
MDVLVRLHNTARQTHWLSTKQPLVVHTQLMAYAQHHADWMAKSEKMLHSKLQDIMNLGFVSAGENVAYGAQTPEKVMALWLWSLNHRRNILQPTFNAIGCGAKKDSTGKLYWCVCFGQTK